jgi:hypothetical protein
MKKSLLAKSVVCVCLFLIFSLTEVFASPPNHESDFFMRASVSCGFAQTEYSDPIAMKYSGPGGGFECSIGYGVLPNLVLHGTYLAWFIFGPTLEARGFSEDISGFLDLSAFGIGITYYIMPINIYISSLVGLGSLSLTSEGFIGETEMGLVFDVTLGKEIFVSYLGGIGVAGTFGYHSIPEAGDIEEKWDGYNIGVKISYTLY